MAKKKKAAAKKKRAKKYEPKLHIDLSFQDAMKVIVKGAK